MTQDKALQQLKSLDHKVQLISHIGALLGWDQETYMPSGAIEERAEQLAMVEGLTHDMQTSSELGDALAVLGVTDDNPGGSTGLSEIDRSLIREVYRAYRKAVKLPKEHVEEFAKQVSISQNTWIKARAESRFSLFAPELEKLNELTLKTASYYGYEKEPYDALLDIYEPGMTTAEVSRVFGALQKDLKEVLTSVSACPQVREDFLLRDYPVDKQEKLGRKVLGDMGYSLERGRLDISAHPFTTTLGSSDIRITTKYKEDFFKTALFGTIHEAGHGLYEQGFHPDFAGTSLGNATSLGIHESQSRFWENMVGRGLPFWKHYFPQIKELFPEQLSDVDLNTFYRGVNRVEPSLIRIEADEVTYGLHIILRFRLETAVTTGKLRVSDLPEAWNETSRELLGIVPQNDAEGVLQDIHWSMGGMGYFPTYALGNLYAAQFASKMRQDIPNIDESFENGDFSPALQWLRQNIHVAGARFTAGELCRNVTGADLDPSFFTRYLKEKFGSVYGF